MNDDLTRRVIGASYEVYNTLGFGFLESVYERALSIELTKLGIAHDMQARLQVTYAGQNVGDFFADFVIKPELIVELKSAAQLATTHEIQLVNYLAATGIELGLLINFGPDSVVVKRKYRTYKPSKT